MNPIYTVPEEISKNEEVLYTGNHYISLPEIHPRKGSIKSLNLGSMSNKALLELRGKEGLFVPSFHRDGKNLDIQEVGFEKEFFYIPHFNFELEEGLRVEMRIYTDLYEKGLILDFSSNQEVHIHIRIQVSQLSFLRFHAHPLPLEKKLGQDPWLNNPLIEIESSKASLALAFGGEDQFEYKHGKNGELVCILTCHGQNAFYAALNSDADGASTTLIHLKRKGYASIYRQWQKWCMEKKIAVPENPYLEKILNENLLFNYFFALGKDLDSDRLFAVTSRSPRYYVSGAFWERDSFLWSLPAIRLMDPKLHQRLIRELILMHSNNAGDHAHYLDGTVLYPGFELDQAASYFILLKDLDQQWMDQTLLWALGKVWNRVEQEYDPETKLYRTFLLPSDDPARYPLVTIDNVILWRGLHNLYRLYHSLGRVEQAEHIQKRIHGIAEGIHQYLVQEVDGKRMFVWSGDGLGNIRLYNDPPGNLGLLHYYGFVDAQDKVFKNTIEYYYSHRYPYFFPQAPIQELACDHHPNTPSGLGLCGSILNPLKREEALDWLTKAKMDFGLLAESFDPVTGEGRTGVGFATGAGYLAFVLHHVLLGGKSHEDCSR